MDLRALSSSRVTARRGDATGPAPQAAPPPWAGAAVVVAFTLIGAILRLKLAGQTLFADELATYWIVHDRGLRGVVSTVHSNAEITPPLSFAIAWVAVHLGDGPELLRAPALLGGIATIPLVYRLGLRTTGRPGAVVAVALTALAPFMLYYSAEARAYGLMMGFTLASTLTMLVAIDTGKHRWWLAYALCSCGAMYSHYTAVFVLVAQLGWLLWTTPTARRQAIVANVGAGALFLPWLSGFTNDLHSPTSDILSAILPLSWHTLRVAVQHWSIGFPYSVVSLGLVPGALALAMLAVAFAATIVATTARVFWSPPRTSGVRTVDKRVVLVGLLVLATPVGELVASAIGSNLLSTRNLAASWPYLALAAAGALVAAGRRLRFVTAGLAIVAFAIGAAKTVQDINQRPDFRGAARYVDREATSRDVVVDESGYLTPGPLTAFDASSRRPHRIWRALAPSERDHPFGVFDPDVTRQDALASALAAADGGRIFLVANVFSKPGDRPGVRALEVLRIPGYRRVEARVYSAFPGGVQVQVYARQR